MPLNGDLLHRVGLHHAFFAIYTLKAISTNSVSEDLCDRQNVALKNIKFSTKKNPVLWQHTAFSTEFVNLCYRINGLWPEEEKLIWDRITWSGSLCLNEASHHTWLRKIQWIKRTNKGTDRWTYGHDRPLFVNKQKNIRSEDKQIFQN